MIKYFKECYKCYSILVPVGDIYAITYTPFSMFAN